MANKNIVLCFDGTWNHPAKEVAGKNIYTNVWKLYYAAVEQEKVQIKWYDRGVGVEGLFHEKIIGGATGKGIEENVIDGYVQLLERYQPGDKIFLFGFSRGATTARILASLLHFCGIVEEEKWEVNPENASIDWSDIRSVARKALDIYLNSNITTRVEAGEKIKRGRSKKWITDRFRTANSYQTSLEIRMLGVWDTVSALTTCNRKYHDVLEELIDLKTYPEVKYACHAVSIDEVRGDFALIPFKRARGKRAEEISMKEVWFAGAHSNVGGGFVDSGLSDIALEWMLSEAIKQGLLINTHKLRIHPDVLGELQHPEEEFIYPLRRKNSRRIPRGSKIHASVFERLAKLDEYYQEYSEFSGNKTKYEQEQTCYKKAPSHEIEETDNALEDLMMEQNITMQ